MWWVAYINIKCNLTLSKYIHKIKMEYAVNLILYSCIVPAMPHLYKHITTDCQGRVGDVMCTVLMYRFLFRFSQQILAFASRVVARLIVVHLTLLLFKLVVLYRSAFWFLKPVWWVAWICFSFIIHIQHWHFVEYFRTIIWQLIIKQTDKYLKRGICLK